ncbi:hypothetical protein ES705_42730 [subsurface metagenome]
MAKGPFMEYLRQEVKMTTINTFTEVAIATPTSKTENMAMLIHSIELQPVIQVDGEPTELDSVALCVTKTHQTGPVKISDPDCIATFIARTKLAAVFNALIHIGSQETKFDPPILYPKSHLYLSIYSTGMALVSTGNFRIGYTLEKVSREDFISALVE